jgi:hypothetical protein
VSEPETLLTGAESTQQRGLWLGLIRRTGRWALRLPRWFWLAAAVAWAGGIWYLSSRPGGRESTGLFHSWAANMAHAPLFGLLALWIALALPREETALGFTWARFGLLDFRLAFWAVVAYGLLDEYHQSTTGTRDASVYDLLTDWAAAYITLGIAALAGRAEVDERTMRRHLIKGVAICCLTGLAATVGS